MPTLSAYFLSLKRLSEILPGSAMTHAGSAVSLAEVPTAAMQRLHLLSAVESALERWLIASKVPPLAELMLTRTLVLRKNLCRDRFHLVVMMQAAETRAADDTMRGL